MRIRSGNITLHIRGAADIIYDAHSDTIDINPTVYTPHEAVEQRRIAPQSPLQIPHERPTKIIGSGPTKKSLTQKIMGMVNESDVPVAMLAFTWECLGRGASTKDKTYLKMLLEELAAAGEITGSVQNGRKRYARPE